METVTEEEEEHIQRAAATESGAFDIPDLSASNVSQTQLSVTVRFRFAYRIIHLVVVYKFDFCSISA